MLWLRLPGIATHRASGTGQAPEFEKTIRVEQSAGYAYPDNREPVLQDIGFNIAQGTATVIIGLSGARQNNVAGHHFRTARSRCRRGKCRWQAA
jgi:ABC-type protease/lipase transport system fused ATPase/permease subunit